MENPIRVIRRGKSLSLRQAAVKVGCHYQAIYMTEHGMYFSIPPTILTWAVKSSDLGGPQIEIMYCEFRSVKIDEASKAYNLNCIEIDSLGPPGTNPVKAFRESLGLSTSKFCKQFRIPVALLYEAEHRAVSLSKKMREVLQDMRVPNRVILEMGSRYNDL